MDITDFLKDVNHWGVLAVCVYGIIVCVSYLFKKSVNEKIRIAMTVIAVAFLAGIIVWVLFYGNGRSEITASNSQAQNVEQLAMMKRQLDTALKSLDIKEREIHSLREKLSNDMRSISSRKKSDSHDVYDVLQVYQLGVKMKESADGVIIDTVIKGSLADRAGMLPGDVISELNDKRIKSFDDIEQQFMKLPSEPIAKFKIIHRKMTRVLFIRLEEVK